MESFSSRFAAATQSSGLVSSVVEMKKNFQDCCRSHRNEKNIPGLTFTAIETKKNFQV